MRWALAAAMALAIATWMPARAEEGDAARLERGAALVVEQLRLTLTVVTAAGSTVELDPASPSWAGIEVVEIVDQGVLRAGDREFHTLEVLVAGFAPGPRPFVPVVNVVRDGEAVGRELPPVEFAVLPTLRQGDPLELTPLPAPVAIGGAESPLLRPAIAAAFLAGALVVLLFLRWLWPRVQDALRRPEPAPGPAPQAELSHAESLIQTDPVRAYRLLAATIRAVLGDRYALPARALTTRELERRMGSAGVDRGQARLVGGLLEECDAVVYAGYRPAAERREADLTVAREIVEVPG